MISGRKPIPFEKVPSTENSSKRELDYYWFPVVIWVNYRKMNDDGNY